jgi:hypothetical protein
MVTRRPKGPKTSRQKHPPRLQRNSVEVDVESLLSVDTHCGGCAKGERCCCASYDVCVTAEEMKRIIRYLPEAAKYCPHLATAGGYDNIFDEDERGLFSIDTTEDGLCLLAYWSDRRVHCSLHTVAIELGLPLSAIKPKVCLLWPLHFSDDVEVLAIIGDAMRFTCNVRRPRGARDLSPGLVRAIDMVYGEGCGEQVENAAARGERRTMLIPRK